jgi:hypothetical protein
LSIFYEATPYFVLIPVKRNNPIEIYSRKFFDLRDIAKCLKIYKLYKEAVMKNPKFLQ